mmetsp:Transcript_600/g.660  ORF Transcript_600/g.660 Transcript_600/m.660 type:complete len:128 (+) Transcript_600:192-575(+)
MNNLCILLVAFIVFLVNNSKVDCLANTSRKAFIDSVVLLVGFTPESVKAFERRDVGEEGSRSAETIAFNEQAYITNNRLEASGLKLDTKEEDQKKLADAMKSFSYESSTPSRKKFGNDKPSITPKTK